MGVWDNIKKIFFTNKDETKGSQRSLALASYDLRKEWDLEIEELPIRSPAVARQLIEIKEACYEAKFCLRMAIEDTFAGFLGDDQDAWLVSDFIDKDMSVPINTETKDIIMNLIARKENYQDYVIGGNKLERALALALSYGDCFAEIGIEKVKGQYQVSKLLYLPTWEMFRKEDDQGRLEGFEQRKYITSVTPDIKFHPAQVIHFRYDQKVLYGQSIFLQSVPYWDKLKEAIHNLQIASRNLAMNPNLHVYAEGMTQNQMEQYRNTIEQRKRKQEIITDIYLYPEMDIRKITNVNPSLKPLADTILEWRARMIPAGFPTYNFPNFPSQKARDISGEPSRRYSRMRNSWCEMLTKGIRQVIDTEIILNKGYEWWQQNGQYVIQWTDLLMEQTSTRNPDELEGINDRGNEGESDNEET